MSNQVAVQSKARLKPAGEDMGLAIEIPQMKLGANKNEVALNTGSLAIATIGI